jgi:talin
MLMGVARDCVMRLDAETKEIVTVWPLSTLRRWAASPNSFTLDFGDYADAYYSVLTSEGEQISTLISGYIDIIMKRRKETNRQLEEGEEQMAITEERMRPARGEEVHISMNRFNRASEFNVATTGVMQDDEGRVGARQIIHKKQFAQASDYGYSPEQAMYVIQAAQQALIQTITSGHASVVNATADLAQAVQLPPLGMIISFPHII